MRFIIKTLHGLEETLASEVRELGGKEVRTLSRAVACMGDKEFLYKCNHNLRTALRILTPIHSFSARTDHQLYKGVFRWHWEKIIDVKQTFRIDQTIYSPHFTHSQYAALKAKDAIVDRIRKNKGKRPSIELADPDIIINLHIHKDNVNLSLDSTGSPLNQRGYRKQVVEAPLNEVLAAGLILLSGWQPDQLLLDPFCGSGTIVAEAALIATNTPPQLRERQYAFMKWREYDKDLWQKVIEWSEAKIIEANYKIRGSDISSKAISITRQNLSGRSAFEEIRVKQQSFLDLEKPADSGTLITNPPYGERVTPKDLYEKYKEWGDHLKYKFPGWEAWLLTANEEALKKMWLKPSKRISLFNGPLEATYAKFELFKGSRKDR